MLVDLEKMAVDYAECYADKSRIKFIEKYLSTYNASVRKDDTLYFISKTKGFFEKYSGKSS